MGGCLAPRPAPAGLGNGSPWLQPRAWAVGRARAHDARAGVQPAESQTRLVAFFSTEELAIDCETLPAVGSRPRERKEMSGRGRAGEGATMGGKRPTSPGGSWQR